jgi:hypothetical protein
MFIYMIYFVTMQIFSFFMVGSFFISIKLFFERQFKDLTDSPGFQYKNYRVYEFFNGEGNLTFSVLFTYAYITLLVFTILVSLAVPIDRAISYFRIIAAIFSVFTICSLVGVAAFLVGTGLWAEVYQWNPD